MLLIEIPGVRHASTCQTVSSGKKNEIPNESKTWEFPALLLRNFTAVPGKNALANYLNYLENPVAGGRFRFFPCYLPLLSPLFRDNGPSCARFEPMLKAHGAIGDMR
jgi:hypothetical protein